MMVMSYGKGQCKTVIIETNKHMANNRIQWLCTVLTWCQHACRQPRENFHKGFGFGAHCSVRLHTLFFFFFFFLHCVLLQQVQGHWQSGHGKKDIIRERRCLRVRPGRLGVFLKNPIYLLLALAYYITEFGGKVPV